MQYKPTGMDHVSPKYFKKYKTGRWEWITKSTQKGHVVVGMRRKSTGEEIFFV
jgi:hypothetical protein